MDDSKLYPVPADNGRIMLLVWMVVLYLCVFGILSGFLMLLHAPSVFTSVSFALGASLFAAWHRRIEEKVVTTP